MNNIIFRVNFCGFLISAIPFLSIKEKKMYCYYYLIKLRSSTSSNDIHFIFRRSIDIDNCMKAVLVMFETSWGNINILKLMNDFNTTITLFKLR